MSQENNYWLKRLDSGRFSRRRFVGGAAVAGVGAASLGLVGCGDDDSTSKTTTTAASTTTAAGSSPAASPTAAAAKPTKGGTARFSSANGTYDTFDLDRSRFTPFAALVDYTNLGLVQYKNFAKGELEPAFAEKYEQPDASTLVFTLRQKQFWHNKAPVNGREATVDDIVQFLNRNKSATLSDGTKDPNFYRSGEYQGMESVTATDATHVTIKFAKPNPFFLGTLASAYAKIQAPEAVKAFEKDYQNFNEKQIIGTGPYVLTAFKAEGTASLRRHEKYFGDAWIDGIDYFPLFTDNAALQAAWEQKQIDMFSPRNKTVADDLSAKYKGKATLNPAYSTNPMAGTYYAGAKPWSDPNLIGAIFRSIDRRALIQQMFQGLAALSGNVPPSQQAFGITEKELITYPGYLEDHAKDLAEAKKMWEAGGGPALGKITIDIPDIWEGSYSGVSALIVGMLKGNLGNEFEAKIEPYSTITGKLVKQQYGNGNNAIWYGWITDVTKLEPSLDLFNTYNSTSPQFPYNGGLKIAAVDDLTSKLVVELDVAKRQDMTKKIDIELIKAHGAGVPYNMVNITNTLQWNYVKGVEFASFLTQHQFGAQVWFDQKDPTWADRKA
jgi:ABC-type transport system substrate-binding protein